MTLQQRVSVRGGASTVRSGVTVVTPRLFTFDLQRKKGAEKRRLDSPAEGRSSAKQRRMQVQEEEQLHVNPHLSLIPAGDQ